MKSRVDILDKVISLKIEKEALDSAISGSKKGGPVPEHLETRSLIRLSQITILEWVLDNDYLKVDL